MRTDTEKAAGVMLAALLLIILALLMPFAYIWAWNILFGSVYTIPMNFWTWLATLLLSSNFLRRVHVSK